MNQPLVTISIPIYKCEDFLEKCLQSVRLQTYQNLEVTLINDETPDCSVEIANNFIENYQLQNWEIYHLEKNSGLSVVRNKGIETARGKYLFFLDSDDQIFPDAIELMVNLAENQNLQMVVGNAETINIETGKITNTFFVNTIKTEIIGNSNIFKSFINGNFPTTSWNKLIDVKFLREKKIYFTRGIYAQDELHSFMMFLKLESIGFLHRKTYQYFLHKNSVIHNRDKKHFDNWFTIIEYFNAAYINTKEDFVKVQIKKHLINYKTMTLIMNWKAKKNDADWLYSFRTYKKVPNLSWLDYFNNKYNFETKKKSLKLDLPPKAALYIFKKLYYR